MVLSRDERTQGIRACSFWYE